MTFKTKNLSLLKTKFRLALNTKQWINISVVSLKEWKKLLVDWLASVDPFAVDINWFGEIVNCGLKIFETYATRDASGVSRSVHFDFAWLLVITKRTVEQHFQWFYRFPFGRRLSFTLSFSHQFISKSNIVFTFLVIFILILIKIFD